MRNGKVGSVQRTCAKDMRKGHVQRTCQAKAVRRTRWKLKEGGGFRQAERKHSLVLVRSEYGGGSCCRQVQAKSWGLGHKPNRRAVLQLALASQPYFARARARSRLCTVAEKKARLHFFD